MSEWDYEMTFIKHWKKNFSVRPFQKGFFNPKVKIISNLWLGQFFEMVWKNSPQTCVCTACLLWCNAACLDVQSFYSRLHIQDCINSRYYGVAQFQEGISKVLEVSEYSLIQPKYSVHWGFCRYLIGRYLKPYSNQRR